MDGFGNVLNSSPPQHRIFFLLPKQCVVGPEGNRIFEHLYFTLLHTQKQSHTFHVKTLIAEKLKQHFTKLILITLNTIYIRLTEYVYNQYSLRGNYAEPASHT